MPINATSLLELHPLMGRMHKPDIDRATKLPLPFDQQDKRSVIPVEQGDVDQWLTVSTRDAKELLSLAPVPEGAGLLEARGQDFVVAKRSKRRPVTLAPEVMLAMALKPRHAAPDTLL